MKSAGDFGHNRISMSVDLWGIFVKKDYLAQQILLSQKDETTDS